MTRDHAGQQAKHPATTRRANHDQLKLSGIACAGDPGQANPGPDESVILPGTPRYGTVRADAWRDVHPLIHGDRGYFAGWDGELPVLRGTVLRVTVEHLPDGRIPPKPMWLWHAGPGPLSPDELWRAYLARFDEETSKPHCCHMHGSLALPSVPSGSVFVKAA